MDQSGDSSNLGTPENPKPKTFSGQGGKSHYSAPPVPAKMLFNAFWMQWQILILPWQATVYFLSLLTGGLISLTTFLGAAPPGYDYQNKFKEIQRVNEHMHQREDGFRRKIKDLGGQLDSKDLEIRRLKKKLGEARQELGTPRTMKRTDSAQEPLNLVSQPVKEPSKMLVHFLFWFCGALPVYWLHQQPAVPGLSRKFVWSLIGPSGMLYLFGVIGDAPSFARPFISLSSIFLLGFCVSNWLQSHC